MVDFVYAVEILEEGETHDYAYFPSLALAQAYVSEEAGNGYKSWIISGSLANDAETAAYDLTAHLTRSSSM